MAVHPLWRPFELADLDEVAAVRIGTQPPRTIEVVEYDEGWPAAYESVRSRIAEALGDRVLGLAHVGSTSVPGLAAKAVIDVDLLVADSADEVSYVPDLEAAGFVLRVRDPDWEEHRVLTIEAPKTNLHVTSADAVEPRRHVLFRDWLRDHDDDRDTYAALKLALNERGFTDSMDYNNHKSELVYDLYEKAFLADPAHPHDPQPRA